MKRHLVSMPELEFIAVTRVVLGVGIGLVASEHIDRGVRRGVGWTLLGVGGLATIPILAQLWRSDRTAAEPPAHSEYERRPRVNTGF
jgi:hypothetical protein